MVVDLRSSFEVVQLYFVHPERCQAGLAFVNIHDSVCC